jgi:predicted nucleic acid-binding protein
MAHKSPLVAVDTNVLLDLAAEDEACWDCMDTMKARRELPRWVILPTVLQELAHLVDHGETAEVQELALTALQSLLSWGFEPLDLQPVGHGIVERIGDEIRSRGLIPARERNDSFIIAEAALCDCDILISSDSPVYGVDQRALHALLNDFHVKPVAILWPRQVVRVLGK